MRKIFVFVLGILIISVVGHFSLPKAYAEITVEQVPNPVCQDSNRYTLIFKSHRGDFNKETTYSYVVWDPSRSQYTSPFRGSDTISELLDPKKNLTNQEFRIEMDISKTDNTLGQWKYKLWRGRRVGDVPKDGSDLIYSFGEYTMYPIDTCTLGLPILEMLSPVQMGKATTITVRNINLSAEYEVWFIYGQEFLRGTTFSTGGWTISDDPDVKTGEKATLSATLENNKYGPKILCLKHGSGKKDCEVSIPITVTQQSPKDTPVIIRSSEPGESLNNYSSPNAEFSPINHPLPCAQWADLQDNKISKEETAGRKDIKCIAVNTAIGPISTEPQAFVRSIFSLVLGLAGGIALILIILSGYRMMASQGNPEALTNARSQLIAAIVGLLFIIFSFVILQVIGVDILRIPGFEK